MKQYRNYFKNYYKLCFGKDYEVHHIDLNHNNNDISNLMLLPNIHGIDLRGNNGSI